MDNLAVIIVLGIFAGIGVLTILALATIQAIILCAGLKDRIQKSVATEKEHNSAMAEDKRERYKLIRQKKQDIEDIKTADALAKLEDKKQQTKKSIAIKTERSKFKSKANLQEPEESVTEPEESATDEVITEEHLGKNKKEEKARIKAEKRAEKDKKKQEKALAKANKILKKNGVVEDELPHDDAENE